MNFSLESLEAVLSDLYPTEGPPPPRPLALIGPLMTLRRGEIDARQAAVAGRTTRHRMESLASSAQPMEALFGRTPEVSDGAVARVRRTLGQLLIGQLAEQVFEDLWLSSLGDTDLRLRDDRGARSDTDFLVEDGTGRQVFRLNIKFHGATFRKAAEMVGLDPSDTFALATYKIHGALQKQDTEHLPYIFVVIGVRGLTGESVGAVFPDDLVDLVALAHGSRRVEGKRSIEEAVVTRVVERPSHYGIRADLASMLSELGQAEWRVISARRADRLLREMLFERAYALRVRGFAQNYRGAELDMHFSTSNDLHPLQELFETLHTHGMPGLVSRLERGTL